MGTFLNLDISGKIELKFLWKHIWFSILWILGLLLVIFRIDIFLLEDLDKSYNWLRVLLPTVYVILFIVTLVLVKWYYKFALLFYPILLLFWFIPKTVLSKGKIYIFGSYVNWVYTKIKNYKLTIAHLLLLVVTILLFLTIHASWVKWLFLIILSYLYLRFVLKF